LAEIGEQNMKKVAGWIKNTSIALMAGLALSACNTNRVPDASQPVTELRYQSSAGLVNLPELAKDLGYLDNIKLNYVGTVQGGPQDLLTLVAGDVDFASAFNGAVVKVIAAGLDVVPVVASYGCDHKQSAGFYVLENSPIRTAKDFIGKKVAMNTFGAHHDFVLRDWLEQNGLTAQEISEVEFIMLPPITSEQALRNGQIDVAVLTSITEARALKNGGVRKIFADVDMYGEFTAGSYSMRKDFVEQHPEVAKSFVEGVAKAHHWLQTTPIEDVRARFDRIIAERGRNENHALIPYFKGYGVNEKGGVQKAEDFAPWIQFMEKENKLKPGQLNAETIFSNQFNPYAQPKLQGL